eukprot:38835-Prymnesium_polylepis.2
MYPRVAGVTGMRIHSRAARQLAKAMVGGGLVTSELPRHARRSKARFRRFQISRSNFNARPRPTEAALRWASGRPTSPPVPRTRSKPHDAPD